MLSIARQKKNKTKALNLFVESMTSAFYLNHVFKSASVDDVLRDELWRH